MTWFLLASLSPLLWAICNHIDKILLSHYLRQDGVGALLIVSALASGLAAPIFALVDPTVFDFGAEHALPIILTAMLDIVLIWAYLKAMEQDDSSNVVVYYQLVPLLGLLFGRLLLDEHISDSQYGAMAVILAGTSLVAFEEAAGHYRFKGRTAAFMLLACTCWAAELTVFKVVALEENPWRSLFWKHIALMIFGLGLYAGVPRYRAAFRAAMRASPGPVLLANLANESLYVMGTIAYGLAVMGAPVALVLLTESFQSIFVFVIAIGVSRFLPRLATETHSRQRLLQKSVAIAITGLGTYWLVTAT